VSLVHVYVIRTHKNLFSENEADYSEICRAYRSVKICDSHVPDFSVKLFGRSTHVKTMIRQLPIIGSLDPTSSDFFFCRNVLSTLFTCVCAHIHIHTHTHTISQTSH